jgi:DNA-binding transcriptional LysR family regulator
MQLTQMRYFVEICENDCNMTKASKKLHVSQSAMSKAIRELEKELSVLLFKRINQRIELTSDGAFFLLRVKDILNKVDELPELMRRQMGSQLVLGIHPSLSYFMFDFLNDFSAAYPDITVLMSNSNEKRQQLVDSVLSGKMDAAVIVYNTIKNSPDENQLQVYKLKQTQLVYVVEASHPLAYKKMVTYKDIAQYPLYGHIKQVEKKIMTLGIQAKMIVNTHDLRTIGKMVRQQKAGAILLRELAQAIPGSVIIELVESTSANVAVIAKKEPVSSKTYVLEHFFEYIDKNKEQMMYMFDD